MLAGDGPQKEKILQKIQGYELTNTFILVGHLNNMSSFYNGLDVYINTSVHEGIPMSVLEAMSHGLPVIAPKTGGLVEIVRHGVDGYLVAHRNAADYAKFCLRLITDRAQLTQMGCAARKRIEANFSVTSMTKQYLNLYKKLVDREFVAI